MNNITLKASSLSNPCPICGRTKDGDCRIHSDGEMVLCHHNFGETCPDGWHYVKPSTDDRTGIFVRDYPKTDRPWGKTFKHEYRSFQGTTHTQIRKYKADRSGKSCKWEKQLGKIREVDLFPYRWELVGNEETIFVVEGELCTDDLIGRNVPAVCVRSWSGQQAQLFKGKTVVLMPDCDQEGIKKATTAAALLCDHGATVRWCFLPRIGNWEYLKPDNGLDSYDYFQLGGSVGELQDSVTDRPLQIDINNAHQSKNQGSEEKKVFDLLMGIVAEYYLFKQDTEFGETFVDVITDDIRRTYKLRSKEFKAWLTREVYRLHKKPTNSEALETCLKICEGQAMGNIHEIGMRTATNDGKVYLDLVNDQWQAVEISKQGWRLVESKDLPVRFIRSPVQMPLPLPANQSLVNSPNSDLTSVQMNSGGQKRDSDHSLADLWQLLSIAEESKPLVTAWLLSCLVPTGDKPILVLSAPKGSGKSTIARFLVNLVDHSKSALLPAVGDRRALAVQSRHRWIFAYDNLTTLSTEQQDAMCCASTGAGYMERTLFTDSDVTFVEYRRPQILTAVDLIPTRSDLLDRCLLVQVKPLPESDRKTNEQLDQLFQEKHGVILGALLDLLVTALKNLDSVKQPLQRMASFHKLALAAGIPNFNQTYLASVASAQQEAIKANPIAEAIAELGNFSGTAKELVTKLKEISDDTKVDKLSSRTLGRLLNGTLKSDLEAIGVMVDSYRNKSERGWIITQTDRQANLMSPTSPTSPPIHSKGFSDDIRDSHDVTNATVMSPPQIIDDIKNSGNSHDVTLMSPLEPLQSKDGDVGDINDIKNGTLSVSITEQRSLLPHEYLADPDPPHYYDIEDGNKTW